MKVILNAGNSWEFGLTLTKYDKNMTKFEQVSRQTEKDMFMILQCPNSTHKTQCDRLKVCRDP